MQPHAGSVANPAFARFLRALSVAALELAHDLEAMPAPSHARRFIDDAGLGSLQRLVAEAPGMDSERGASPRQITQSLDRQDEPNIRTALTAMQKRGVAERVPGSIPQRWRLSAAYRTDPG